MFFSIPLKVKAFVGAFFSGTGYSSTSEYNSTMEVYKKDLNLFTSASPVRYLILSCKVHNNYTKINIAGTHLKPAYSPDMAKLRPSKHFLRPLKWTIVVDFWHNFVGKHLNLACFGLKTDNNFLDIFCGPRYFLLFEFGPRAKNSGHPWYSL